MENKNKVVIHPSLSGRLGGAEMFNVIAFRYDLLNQLLSFGIHKHWRKKAIQLLSPFVIHHSSSVILDVATGTADFAIDACSINPKKVIGIDIAEDMLKLGKEKIKKKNLSEKIELMLADSENLPFQTNSFDAATVGFGVRNFKNLEKGLSEIHRTLKYGGVLAVLEFSMPQKFPMKQFYYFYLKNICPLVGKFISGDNTAYTYLFKSVQEFPGGESFIKILKDVGFSEISFFHQTFGITTIYLAIK
ncbi:MAG: bifunctional demethylmenaquinone methyltransferase/2-methoxy-6-polyprenyl-1,4-benzoquinol methylase UbiE [Bacteroidota bacterium]